MRFSVELGIMVLGCSQNFPESVEEVFFFMERQNCKAVRKHSFYIIANTNYQHGGRDN